MATIECVDLVKRFGAVVAVDHITLSVRDGEFVVLVGPSGCGKSTTLRMIAGLETIDGGTVSIGGRVVNRVEPKHRNVAMVFQNYAIYPHMTVERNIGFGLYTAKLSRGEKHERILAAARILELDGLLGRRPAELSGGQRQRVAIGRAMVRDPAAFLFDEPLSNLDAQLRAQMRVEIKKLHQRLGTTVVYVTHDQVEAMTMADRIVVIHAGRILQAGEPMELYDRPADVFTARFIGSPTMNIIDARAKGAGRVEIDDPALSVPAASIAAGNDAGRRLLLGVRPHDLAITPVESGSAGDGIVVVGTVSVVEPLGAETFVHIDTGSQTIVANTGQGMIPKVDRRVRAAASRDRLSFFDPDTGKSLRA